MLKVKDWIQMKLIQAKNPEIIGYTVVSVVRIKDNAILSIHGGKGRDGIVYIANQPINKWAAIAYFSHDMIHMSYKVYENGNPNHLKKVRCEINDFELKKIKWD